MIKHIVIFSWHEHTTSAEVRDVERRLARLPGMLEVLRDYTFGSDLGITEGNGDFAIIATLAGAADLPVYRDHPFHAEVAGDLRAMARARTAVQIDTDAQPGGD
jgi:hypothetical protein